MSDTANLRPYTPRAFPTIEGGTGVYVTDELKKIAATLSQIITAMKALEARMVAGGL